MLDLGDTELAMQSTEEVRRPNVSRNSFLSCFEQLVEHIFSSHTPHGPTALALTTLTSREETRHWPFSEML